MYTVYLNYCGVPIEVFGYVYSFVHHVPLSGSYFTNFFTYLSNLCLKLLHLLRQMVKLTCQGMYRDCRVFKKLPQFNKVLLF